MGPGKGKLWSSGLEAPVTPGPPPTQLWVRGPLPLPSLAALCTGMRCARQRVQGVCVAVKSPRLAVGGMKVGLGGDRRDWASPGLPSRPQQMGSLGRSK